MTDEERRERNRKYVQKWRESHRAEERLRARESRAANIDKERQRERDSAKKRYHADPDKAREHSRRSARRRASQRVQEQIVKFLQERT